MRTILTCSILLSLALGGCLSVLHRTDIDSYEGASGSFTGNGRQTTMTTSASAPAVAPAPEPIVQRAPDTGKIFLIQVHGKTYRAMKKTDGRIYILSEVK
jgi:hypothetical protein